MDDVGTGARRQRRGGMDPRFVGYFVRLAACSVLAVAVVFGAATALIVLIRPSPGWGLAIIACSVAAAIASLALISRRLTARFLGGGR